MAITREQWAEVESAVYEFWDMGMESKKDYNALLYNVQDSEKSQENHIGIGSLGQMTPWTGSVSYEEFKKGFDKGYRHAKYSKGIQFEEEIFRFKEFNKIKQRTSLLMDAVYKTYVAHGVSTFNNAFDAAFAGPDGVALCSATHDYSPTDGTHQSNAFSLDLTMPNLTTVFNAMADFRDDKGEKTYIMPDILLTGISYRTEGMKICGPTAGDKEPFTAENDANIYKGDLRYVYHPGIVGKKWFLIDSSRMKNFLNWYNARKAKIESDGDFDTELQKFKVVGMFSYGFDHWDWIAGSSN